MPDAGTSIKITGLRPLIRQLTELDDGAVDEIKRANRQAALTVAADAVAKAPRRKGWLAASIRVTVRKFSAAVRMGSAKVPYAAPVHWGWPRRSIKANKFVYRALDEHRPEIVRDYDRRIARLVSRTIRHESG